jgi:hypothetical protein
MKNGVAAVGKCLCVLSHLSLCFVPTLCVLSHWALCIVPATLCFVTLLGKSIRNRCIRKMNLLRKSLSKPADLRSQVGASFSLTGDRILLGFDPREVVA